MAGKDPKKTLPPLHEYKEAKVCSKVVSQYGIDALRFNNICWIQDDIFLLSAGKFVQFFNLSTGHVDWEMGPENGGVGFVAVHPSRKFYVVGERTPSNPKIRVYTYPEKTLSFELMDGAISGFSACAFDRQGSRMATVATEPDYTLSLWDWEKKVLLLRNKCFSADVTTVGFSRFDHSLLVTGGSGHIKFWQTAKTFTGVKLQGNLGKFGRMEISNITAFETLPSGKVLSGSESGNLLLWEGDLIKCIFVKTIHDAAGEENVLDTQSFDTVHGRGD
ncbi:hypothetical protein AGDE_15188 [Angomonas deanei]|uniref:WD domain, G-beta repeat n=1 Tax=Angomonas deanei TaxID=59799 RepID=A0A7G2CJ39_9TRYP|nr:hypothetical protein AGDE_15188 [Angomonas deanei]CAD2219395.1 hypothetical protein, conserved [Angomonas deanei]|eukprot:EPY19552.1 hypothetical protein AGDE_15188 [Angomonas deanei]